MCRHTAKYRSCAKMGVRRRCGRLPTYFVHLFVVCRSSVDEQRGEYCHFETFNASCTHLPGAGAGHVIVMTSARYGRMRFGRCMREDHGSVGCAADVLPQLDRKCSGRRECRVTVPDASLHSVHPCPRELMPYLEASYTCLPGRRSYSDCVTVRSMVNIARLTIWSIYCSRGGGEGRADPSIVAPFIGAV